jgi:hypothetical protein
VRWIVPELSNGFTRRTGRQGSSKPRARRLLAVERLHLPHKAAGVEKPWKSRQIRYVFGFSPLENA